MKNSIYLLLSLLFCCMSAFPKEITIHTIGDSTMENKPEDTESNPNGQRGWAQMLQQFVTNGATVNNRSKSGTSSKSFYEAKDDNNNYRFWATVKPQIKEGDYVIIQFGHNDEKDGGEEGEIGTNPWKSYTEYLTKYVTEVRELNATPILFTPIVRNYFESDGKTITARGAHNLGMGSDGKELDYVAAMKKVAENTNCLLVDHTALTKKVCEEYGKTKSTELIYNVGDGTHLGEYGATLYARLAVQELIKQNILTEYLNADPELILSSSEYNFGKCYANTVNIHSFSVSGIDLDPVSGNVTITVPSEFSISKEQDGNYTQQITIPYENGNLSITPFFVKYAPENIGISTGNITVSNGKNSKFITLKGECVSFEGGIKAKAFWELSKNENSISEGPITVLPETFKNMFTDRYAKPGSTTIWEDNRIDGETKTQRNIIEGRTWPAGEIDIVHDRYIQFGVKATKGSIFNVDSIGLYAGGSGSNGIRFKVYYCKNELFGDDAVMIADRQNNTSNTMYPISHKNIIEVKSEESLYIRIYPWLNNGGDSKSICLYGVTISGVVTEESTDGITTSLIENNIFCYPSKTSGITTLNYVTTECSDVLIDIFSVDGKKLNSYRKDSLPAGQHQQQINLEGLNNGIYICSLTSNTDRKTIRLIKE